MILTHWRSFVCRKFTSRVVNQINDISPSRAFRTTNKFQHQATATIQKKNFKWPLIRALAVHPTADVLKTKEKSSEPDQIVSSNILLISLVSRRKHWIKMIFTVNIMPFDKVKYGWGTCSKKSEAFMHMRAKVGTAYNKWINSTSRRVYTWCAFKCKKYIEEIL